MSRTSGTQHNKKYMPKHCRLVLCVDTDEVFPSIREAAQRYGIGEDAISQCCRGRQKTAGGKRFAYLANTACGTVFCIETAVSYGSVQDAAQKTGVNPISIAESCADRNKTAGGYHWVNAESLCLDCKNALGGCTWSVWDWENGVPLFRPVEGWDAVTVRRAYSTRRRKSTTYHVLRCPQYIQDQERDLSRYKEVDEKIESEKEP